MATTVRSETPALEESYRDYFDGKKLYGDDLDPQAIERWLADEKEAYAEICGENDKQHYEYHALNTRHGFRHLRSVPRFDRVLSVGGAFADELRPVLDRIGEVTVLEPSDALVSPSLDDVPLTYVKPRVDGSLPFEDKTFDLITCFGVLHHVPNVSRVMGEIFRCTRPGGHMLVREPTVSMGDWRVPRPTLTRHERGIPIGVFRQIIASTGFTVVRETRCMFPATKLIGSALRHTTYNSPAVVAIDTLLSNLFRVSKVYHATKAWQKLRPASVFYVLRRP